MIGFVTDGDVGGGGGRVFGWGGGWVNGMVSKWISEACVGGYVAG